MLASKILSPILILALVISAGAIGHLWTKNQYLQKQADVKIQVAGEQAGQPALPSGLPVVTVNNVSPISDDDLVRGSRDARIALIEYSDLECPFCKSFHPTAQQIVDAYNGQVMWVYRHFPLQQIHPKAQKLAEAVECTQKLNNSETAWQLIDAIFADPTIGLNQLAGLTADLGVNQTQLQNCLDTDQAAAPVEADYTSAIQSTLANGNPAIAGTPGNILLDTQTGAARLLSGALPFETFKTAIDQILAD